MDNDRRQEIRIPLVLPLECQNIGNVTNHASQYDLACQDLSCRGMSLTSEMPLDVGETLVFSLSLPHGPRQEGITGAVRWCAGPPEPRKIGIQFTKPLDLSVPLSVTSKVVGSLQQQSHSVIERLFVSSSDAFTWIDSEGKIASADQRFLDLLGCSDAEVVGQPLVAFIHPGDQNDFSKLLRPHKSSTAASDTGHVRIRAKDSRSLFWRMRMLPKSPWSLLQGVCIEDLTEAYEWKIHHHQLKQVTDTLEDDFPGRVVLLNSDLTVAHVRGAQIRGKKEKRKITRVRGRNLRKVTGLTEIKVNGGKLWDVLEYCVQTGKESEIQPYHYQGRSRSTSDLFPPGTFRTKVTPIQDLKGEITSLLMRVSPEDPLGIHDHQSDKGQKNQDRLGKILRAAATGFLLKEVLTRFDSPLTYLVTEMDLLSSKLEQHMAISSWNDDKTPQEAVGITRARKHIGVVAIKLRQVLDNMWSPVLQEDEQQLVNICLSKAIQTAKMAAGMEGIPIKRNMESGLPQITINSHELTMAFLIFLLLSKDCLSNVSLRTIHCSTQRDGDNIVAGISHNGFIQEDRYLSILFHRNPLEGFFLNCTRVNPVDTLLYYVNYILKKNALKIRLTNIPGHFNLSVIIPGTVP